MFYVEYQPSEFLNRFIKCYWVLENTDSSTNSPEPILPDGSPEIVFNLSDRFKRYFDGQVEMQPQTIVVGQIKKRVLIEPTGGVKLFGIRFKPNGLYPILKQPLGEITNKIEAIEEVFGVAGRELEDRLFEADSLNQRIQIIERTLAKFYVREEDPTVTSYALDLIARSSGNLSVRDLARFLDTTEKTLERRFKREVGITPKLFCRITRLQKVLQVANEIPRVNWADLANSAGYFDQAHFINEFREFADVSPVQFLENQTRISDSFVG